MSFIAHRCHWIYAELSAEYGNTLGELSLPLLEILQVEYNTDCVAQTKAAMDDALDDARQDSDALDTQPTAMTHNNESKGVLGSGDSQRRTEPTGEGKQLNTQTDLWDMPLPVRDDKECQGVTMWGRRWWEDEE